MSLLDRVSALVGANPDSSKYDRRFDGGRRNRRMNGDERAMMDASNWSNISHLKLEDKVSLADSKAVFLQGNVAYVGQVHFDDGIWVGIQLTGPSIGKGTNDGSINGKRYFPNVGKNNGYMAPIHEVHKRTPLKSGDPNEDASQELRRSERAQLADLKFIDSLAEEREIAMLKRSEEKRRFTLYDREEAYIRRLKELRLEELRRARKELPPSNTFIPKGPSKLKFGALNSDLRKSDLELVKGLEMTQQNFCLSDPNLPDNPLIYASQAFLNMTGYSLNEILGRNCRFLQGPETDPHHIHRIRVAIQEGNDCLVCLVNYRADGSKFYNRCFIAALRDNKDRVKNYIGVQCEVSPSLAEDIMKRETDVIESKYISARLATASMSLHDSEHSKNHRWRDTMREEGSQSTWRSDMSQEFSSPKVASTQMSVPKQLYGSGDLDKVMPRLSREVTTLDVSFQSLKISDNSSHGAPVPDVSYLKVKSQKQSKNASVGDHSFPTVKVGTRKKSHRGNGMSSKEQKETIADDLNCNKYDNERHSDTNRRRRKKVDTQRERTRKEDIEHRKRSSSKEQKQAVYAQLMVEPLLLHQNDEMNVNNIYESGIENHAKIHYDDIVEDYDDVDVFQLDFKSDEEFSIPMF
jgi:PAS domain S-box-containing protein